jgi:hypothetical protein
MNTIDVLNSQELAPDPPPDSNMIAITTPPGEDADAFEISIQKEATAQFKRLKDNARAIYGLVEGMPGVRTPEKWAEMLEKPVMILAMDGSLYSNSAQSGIWILKQSPF